MQVTVPVGGDAIDLIVWLDGCTKAEAIERLAEVGIPRREPRQARTDNPKRAAEHDLLVRWCASRGWGPWIIRTLDLSVVVDQFGRRRIRCPYRLGGHGTPYWQDRALDENVRVKWLSPKGRKPILYEADRLKLARERGAIVVVEGVTDVMAILDSYTNPAVVGVPGTGAWRSRWAQVFTGLSVYAIADNDAAGERLRQRLDEDIGPVAAVLHHVRVPPEHNDLAAWRAGLDPGRVRPLPHGADRGGHQPPISTRDRMTVTDASLDYARVLLEDSDVGSDPSPEFPTNGGPPKDQENGIPTTWLPVDVPAVLRRGLVTPVPTMLARTDGACLIYPGKVHAFNAAPEEGKSLFAQYLCAERVVAGEHVLYVDFEADVEGVLERMRCLGLGDGDLGERIHYIRPDDPIDERAMIALDEILGRFVLSVVVLDGVAEVMVQNGWDENKNADVATFLNTLPRLLERRGCTVVMIDHVVKDREGQGRYARGAGHKLAGISGAAYRLDLLRPFGRGMTGLVKVMVTKDRPGSVRPHAVGGKAADMHVVSNPETGVITLTLQTNGDGQFRPTNLMEKISRVLEIAVEPMSVNQVLEATQGNRDARITALRCLVDEGYARREKKGQAFLHWSERPFREADEQLSEDDEGQVHVDGMDFP